MFIHKLYLLLVHFIMNLHQFFELSLQDSNIFNKILAHFIVRSIFVKHLHHYFLKAYISAFYLRF